MSDKVISSTTQEFLDVYDIVNDMVLLKDGTAAVILQIGTMNFSLLAEQEQDAVIFTYGSLLNSLNYPIQINIQSQTKDATKYLRLLDEQIKKASSDRKAILIRQYRDFVATLIRERNVLQKRFYIVVPATPGEMGLITPAGVLPGKTTFDITSVEKSILLEKATNLLEPRRDHLVAQFNRLGLFAKQLSTQEIIQNFYINYNPEAAEGQEISSSENYTTPLVRASFGGKFMQINQQQSPIQTNQTTQENQNVQAQTAPPVSPVNQTPAAPNQNPEPALKLEMTPQAEPAIINQQNQVVEPNVNSPTPEEILGSNTIQTQASQIQAPIQTQESTPIMETNFAEQNQNSGVEIAPVSGADQIVFQNQDLTNTQNTEPTTIQPEIQLGTQLPEPSQDFPVNQPTSQEPQTINSIALELPNVPMVDEDQTTNLNTGDQNQADDFAEDITPLQNKFEAMDQEKTS